MALLEPKLQRQAQAIEKRINQRKFSRVGASLRRQNPNGEDLVLNTRMVDATIPSIAHWADWSLTKYGFSGSLVCRPGMPGSVPSTLSPLDSGLDTLRPDHG
jgi:hypothetical protein